MPEVTVAHSFMEIRNGIGIEDIGSYAKENIVKDSRQLANNVGQ
jgi:hypothetical protein